MRRPRKLAGMMVARRLRQGHNRKRELPGRQSLPDRIISAVAESSGWTVEQLTGSTRNPLISWDKKRVAWLLLTLTSDSDVAIGRRLKLAPDQVRRSIEAVENRRRREIAERWLLERLIGQLGGGSS